MRLVTGVGRFLWDFFIGDTPELAVGALLVLGAAGGLTHHRDAAIFVVPFTVLAVLSVSLWQSGERRSAARPAATARPATLPDAAARPAATARPATRPDAPPAGHAGPDH